MTTAALEFRIEREDVSIAVRDYGGDGPDIVLLHGWGGNVGSWEHIAPALASSFHVVAFDQRGHGQSSSAGSYAFSEWVADLELVLHETDARDPTLVGHSWGGRVALSYAGSRGGCRGVVSVDGANTRMPTRDFDLEQERSRWAADPLATFSGSSADFERFLEQVSAQFSDQQWTTYEPMLRRRFVTIGTEVRHHISPEELVLLEQPIEGADPPVVDFYAGVECPVLLINARDADAAEKEATAVEVTRGHPRVTIVWLDGGHDLPAERPTELVNMISGFHRKSTAP